MSISAVMIDQETGSPLLLIDVEPYLMLSLLDRKGSMQL